MESLRLNQAKDLLIRRDNDLPQFFQIADRSFARRGWRSACKLKHDERMTEDAIGREQLLEEGVGTAEVSDPNRCIREDKCHRRLFSAGLRRGIFFIVGAFPPNAANRFPAWTRTNTLMASRNKSDLSMPGSANSSALW